MSKSFMEASLFQGILKLNKAIAKQSTFPCSSYKMFSSCKEQFFGTKNLRPVTLNFLIDVINF